jgi:hypothetical protein
LTALGRRVVKAEAERLAALVKLAQGKRLIGKAAHFAGGSHV